MPGKQPIRYVILGGGGHTRVLIDTLRAAGAAEPDGIVEANQKLWGQRCDGVDILEGGDERLPALVQGGVTHFIVGVGGVGNNDPRRGVFERARASGLRPLDAVVHPRAECSPSAGIGAGSVVFALAVINAGATLGENVIVNTKATVEHDCIVGHHVHVAPHAVLGGGVRVGDGAHIGQGATIRQGLTIGERAIVGVGAAVVKDVRGGATVFGVPAEEDGHAPSVTCSVSG